MQRSAETSVAASDARLFVGALVALITSWSVVLLAQPSSETPTGPAETTIDLSTKAGVDAIKGQWRFSDVKIVETEFKAAGPEGQPTGSPVKTYDIAPHAG